MIASMFLDLIVVLLWPLILSAAVWAIVVKALAERDEISAVVEALTRSNGVEENANRGGTFLRRRNSHAIASSNRGWFQVHFWHKRHAPPNTTRAKAKVGAAKKTLQRDDERSEHVSPIKALASLRTILPILLAAVLIAASAPPVHAGRFEFDQRRTEVRFVYKMAYSTQRGRFTKVSGTLDYDEAAPEKSKIAASITAASLTTGEALVDNELKGAAFFNVEVSPVIVFRSLAVRPFSATAADVSGEITVNGITKPATLKVSINPHDDPALKHDAGAREFIATTRIKRSAFNMTDYQSMVDDDIDIEIVAIARPRL